MAIFKYAGGFISRMLIRTITQEWDWIMTKEETQPAQTAEAEKIFTLSGMYKIVKYNRTFVLLAHFHLYKIYVLSNAITNFFLWLKTITVQRLHSNSFKVS